MEAGLARPFALTASDYRLPPALKLRVVEQTGSTNSDLLALARAGELADGQSGDAQVLIAHAQSAGRGRQGRNWSAAPGASLLMSVGCIRSVGPSELSGLSVALGARAAQVLRASKLAASVKWPNDLLVNGAKLAGILVETVSTSKGLAIVAGIGLNGTLPPAQQGAQHSIAALQDLIDITPEHAARIGHDLAIAFADLLLSPSITQAVRTDLSRTLAGVDACVGREVKLISSGTVIAQGFARGVDTDGALLLETASGITAHAIGEVSLRWQ
jgi:BirA family biotin operon repressor/biotin-[acetyl-CoA-carboxylase] ligase